MTGDMRQIQWEKHGLVLSPQGAPAWRTRHCGMVSVLPWDDGYRMFLTGRDDQGRFQIGWVTLDHSLALREEYAGNPVLTAGRPGCFDGNGLCMPWVVRVSDSVLYLYYVGWGDSSSAMFTNRCGLAISRDNGATWQRWSEAPLALLDDRDPIGIGTVCVLRDAPDAWRLWYTTFREWLPLPDGRLRHYYHIKYAESTDGIHWHKPADNLAIDFIDDECSLGRPMVLKEADGYRMWFCTSCVSRPYRIGYAESPDGRVWTRRPSGIEPSPDGWDAQMVEYAYVLRDGKTYHLFYNGNDFGASGTGYAHGTLLPG